MSNKGMTPYEWVNRFFDIGFRRIRIGRGFFDTRDLFRNFDDINEEMNRMFDLYDKISNNVPKELVREYETKDGDKVREVGPIVYGYSMSIGPDGKPHVQEFGNIKSMDNHKVKRIGRQFDQPSQISSEREPLVDVNMTDKEVKVVVEMPGIRKEDIKIKAYDSNLEITTSKDAQRKYHKNIELPEQAEIESVRSVYKNGILEIIFDKEKVNKPTGKEIKIE